MKGTRATVRVLIGLLLVLLLAACTGLQSVGSPAPAGATRMPQLASPLATAESPVVAATAAVSPQETPGGIAAGGHATGTAAPGRVLSPAEVMGHSGPVTALAWSPDGQILASSSGDWQGDGPVDTVIRLWTAAGRPLDALEGHTGKVYTLAWSPDGKLLASGSADGTVRFWDATGRAVRVLSAGPDPVFALAWSPDGRLLASGAIRFEPPAAPGGPMTLPGVVRLWRPDGTLVRTLSTRYTGGKFYNLAWSPDGKFLAGGAVDYGIWRADGTPAGNTGGCAACTPAWGMAWFPDGQKLATGDESGNVQIYDTTGKLLAETAQLRAEGVAGSGILGGVNQLAFSLDGKTLAIGSTPVRLAPLSDVHAFNDLPSAQIPLAWSPNSRAVATASKEASAQVWKPDGTRMADLEGCQGEARSLAWAPDGRILAAGTEKGEVCLWQP